MVRKAAMRNGHAQKGLMLDQACRTCTQYLEYNGMTRLLTTREVQVEKGQSVLLQVVIAGEWCQLA